MLPERDPRRGLQWFQHEKLFEAWTALRGSSPVASQKACLELEPLLGVVGVCQSLWFLLKGTESQSNVRSQIHSLRKTRTNENITAKPDVDCATPWSLNDTTQTSGSKCRLRGKDCVSISSLRRIAVQIKMGHSMVLIV
jgi:hypothetical protein